MEAFLAWGLEEQQTPEHGSEISGALRSEDELRAWSVDEHLNDTERTVLFLNNGLAIQQRHAITNLPSVIRARGRQGWESVAGALKGALNRLDSAQQMEAAEIFGQIARERLMSPSDLQVCLLPTILRNINKERSKEETDTWMRALFDLMPMLDKEVLRTEVLSMALSKGDVEENINSRVICSRILGVLAQYMTRDEVERGFYKRVAKMCQDVETAVRLSMCQQLAAIGRTMGRETVHKSLLDELVELTMDEDVQVRAAAFTSLVALMDVVTADTRTARVMPVLRNHMQPCHLDPIMQRCVARNFGQMMAVIKNELEYDDFVVFFRCFKDLASNRDVENRRCCAQQFGLVIKAVSSVKPTAFFQHFSDTFQSFASDMDEEVRLSAATQFHDIARYPGKEYVCRLLTWPLVRLLRDESSKVQAALLPMLTTTLQYFAVDDSSQRTTALDDIVRALLDLEANSARNWRLQGNLAAAFPSFHTIFTSDQIYEHFLPMAFRFLSSSAAAVQPAAAEGIACFLRHNKLDRQRAEIFLKLIREYARGRSYSQRGAFAEVCKHIVKRVSSKFIKEWVFDLCLELLYDPVPNVRLQVTHLLPALKQTIRLPEDVDLLERLNNAISNSMTDNDRDVSVTARHINDSYKRMPVRMGGGMFDVSGGAQALYESEDRRKEREEWDFSFSPEDIKEIKAEIVQMSYKRKPGAGSLEVVAGSKSAINRRVDVGGRASGGAVNLPRTGSGAVLSSSKLGTAAAARGLGSSSAGAGASASITGGARLPVGIAPSLSGPLSGSKPALHKSDMGQTPSRAAVSLSPIISSPGRAPPLSTRSSVPATPANSSVVAACVTSMVRPAIGAASGGKQSPTATSTSTGVGPRLVPAKAVTPAVRLWLKGLGRSGNDLDHVSRGSRAM